MSYETQGNKITFAEFSSLLGCLEYYSSFLYKERYNVFMEEIGPVFVRLLHSLLNVFLPTHSKQ